MFEEKLVKAINKGNAKTKRQQSVSVNLSKLMHSNLVKNNIKR